jgi:hypothetical protein
MTAHVNEKQPFRRLFDKKIYVTGRIRHHLTQKKRRDGSRHGASASYRSAA